MEHLSMTIETFRQDINTRIDKLGASFEPDRGVSGADNVAEIIYHYTNMDGALGILNDRAFRFSERAHLDDRSEIIYGINRARELILSSRCSTCLKKKQDFARLVTGKLNKSVSQIGIYVACFTEKYDDLCQWRCYADKGRGVALGFSRAVFEYTASKCDGLNQFGKYFVKYDDNAIDAALCDPISNALNMLNDNNVDIWNDIGSNLAIFILYVSMFFKHPAYIHENEFRVLVFDGANNLRKSPLYKSYVRGHEIVGYLNCPFRPSLCEGSVLRHIVVGPAASYQLEDQLRATLTSLGIPEPKIDRSEIPFIPTR